MNKENKFGLFTYPCVNGTFNIGDYVQSIAAKQYFKDKDFKLINRDKLNSYNSDDLKLIMNGWFTHFPENWPPSEKLNPLFISFHLNKTMESRFFTERTISYLKNHEPIGCRDLTTQRIMKAHGINATYTGCLTLTLGQTYKNSHNSESEVLLVDPIFNLPSWDNILRSPKSFIKNGILKSFLLKANRKNSVLREAVGDEIFSQGNMIKNIIKNKYTEDEKFELAENYLDRLSKAKLVITSRIHCALPCLAMGTPVVFIDSFNEVMDLSRFEGITNLFPSIKLEQLLLVPEKEKVNFLYELSQSGNIDTKMVDQLQATATSFSKSEFLLNA